MINDPVTLAIKALNDIPNLKFNNPIGPYNTTYELVAYLEEIERFTQSVTQPIENAPLTLPHSDVFLYLYPQPEPR